MPLVRRRCLRPFLAGVVAAALSVPVAASAQERLRKGPWLMNHGPGRVTVMAERGTPGPVSLRAWREVPAGTARPAPIVVHSNGPGFLHELELANLAPGSRYRYELWGPGLTTQGGSFNTAPLGADTFRFILYGDTRSHASAHAAIASAMRRDGADFIVHTGDLVSDGRHERDWQEFFEIERDLLRETLFIPVIGNHELRPPAREGIVNFRKYVHSDPDSPNPELDYTLRYGHIRLILSNAYDNWAEAPMRPWLESQLSRARREGPDDFLLVVMHWGMHSLGPHGPNTRLRRAGLDDLFRQYRVDLVVAGHDHVYERGEERGLRYLVTGGGGAPLYSQRRESRYTQSFVPVHHFVRVDADPGRLQFTVLRADGTVIDRFEITHARPAARVEPPREAPSLAARVYTGPQPSEELTPEPEHTPRRRRVRGSVHARTCLCDTVGASLDGASTLFVGAAWVVWMFGRRRRSARGPAAGV